MERDFSIRFTDDIYASKEEIQKALNLSSIDAIWDKINLYRNYFKRSLDLSSIEGKIFSICLTLSLQQKIISLEKRMIKTMIYLSKMNETSLNNFINECLLEIGRDYASQDSITITDDILKKLLDDDLIEVPQAYNTLRNYLLTLKQSIYKSLNKYDLSILTSFYGKILRKEINPNDFDSFARIIDLNNPSDHLVLNQHYSASPLDKIEPMLDELINFNNSNNTFSLIKAVVSYFYLIYIKPFDYFNEECAVLSLKYIITNSDIPYVPFVLNLEKYLLNTNIESFKNKFVLSELSCDLTYFTNYILDIIDKSIKELEEKIENNDIMLIKEEFKQSDEEDLLLKSSIINNEPKYVFANKNPITFEQKVSMPILPTGLDEKDVDLIAENLLELYPSLKINQAKFYASHCTIGKYYSIAQYKKETGVAYETARTSMDNLVALGFYKKEQIKNKYVYTPVIR